MPPSDGGSVIYHRRSLVQDSADDEDSSKRVFLEPVPTNATAATFASVITDRIVLKECYGVIPEIVSDRDTLLV